MPEPIAEVVAPVKEMLEDDGAVKATVTKVMEKERETLKERSLEDKKVDLEMKREEEDAIEQERRTNNRFTRAN